MPQDLSRTEIWLLGIINELEEADAFKILDRISQEKDWQYSTVKTVVERLWKKGYLDKKKVSRRWVYRPAMSKTTSFALIFKRLFGPGLEKDFSPLVNYLVNAKKLNKRDEKILKKLLEKKEESVDS